MIATHPQCAVDSDHMSNRDTVDAIPRVRTGHDRSQLASRRASALIRGHFGAAKRPADIAVVSATTPGGPVRAATDSTSERCIACCGDYEPGLNQYDGPSLTCLM